MHTWIIGLICFGIGVVTTIVAAGVVCVLAERRLFKQRGRPTEEDWRELWDIKPSDEAMALAMISQVGVHWDSQTESYILTQLDEGIRKSKQLAAAAAPITLCVHHGANLEAWKEAIKIVLDNSL